MKTIFISLVAGLAFCGCDSFTEVDLPDSQLTSEIVFADVRTADAALSNIYAQLRDATVLTGLPTGISNTLGVYSDEMTYFGSAGQPTETFYLNNLLETSVAVKTLWNNAYNLIYQANAVYKGVTDSQGISEGDKSRLIGEALYLRAFLHFHLTNLFGEIPYI
ncbi:RagB/SusD family nutrient uptake outer membrane protein, partial [uncultured Flavobacterium sp.]|uniref:RagB/SusD family nutrient uptake outer membrane protein n=1 Tax=uncultured Flavobacterium sp. TaxID=165435 RepID=UPI0025CD2260